MQQGAAPMSDNPAPRAVGAPHENERVSWLAMSVLIDNEAGRRRIRVDEFTRRLAGELTDRERATVQAIIAEAGREAATFEAVSRLIERAQDAQIVARLRTIAAGEAEAADGGDQIRYD